MEKNALKRGITSETMVTPTQTSGSSTNTAENQPKRRNKPRPTPVQLGWTDQRRRAVASHVQLLEPLLRLQDWTIKIKWDKYSDEFDDAYATNTPLGDSRHCEIRFSRKFLELDDQEMTQVIVHEMVHCHLFALEDYSEDIVAELATKKTSNVFNIGHTKLVETAIDGLADAIAGLVPIFILPQR
jgi:hypothetical protein